MSRPVYLTALSTYALMLSSQLSCIRHTSSVSRVKPSANAARPTANPRIDQKLQDTAIEQQIRQTDQHIAAWFAEHHRVVTRLTARPPALSLTTAPSTPSDDANRGEMLLRYGHLLELDQLRDYVYSDAFEQLIGKSAEEKSLLLSQASVEEGPVSSEKMEGPPLSEVYSPQALAIGGIIGSVFATINLVNDSSPTWFTRGLHTADLISSLFLLYFSAKIASEEIWETDEALLPAVIIFSAVTQLVLAGLDWNAGVQMLREPYDPVRAEVSNKIASLAKMKADIEAQLQQPSLTSAQDRKLRADARALEVEIEKISLEIPAVEQGERQGTWGRARRFHADADIANIYSSPFKERLLTQIGVTPPRLKLLAGISALVMASIGTVSSVSTLVTVSDHLRLAGSTPEPQLARLGTHFIHTVESRRRLAELLASGQMR